jgi:hypothetical protein
MDNFQNYNRYTVINFLVSWKVRNSRVAEQLAASQGRLSSSELVIPKKHNINFLVKYL